MNIKKIAILFLIALLPASSIANNLSDLIFQQPLKADQCVVQYLPDHVDTFCACYSSEIMTFIRNNPRIPPYIRTAEDFVKWMEIGPQGKGITSACIIVCNGQQACSNDCVEVNNDYYHQCMHQ